MGAERPNIITLSWAANVCSEPPTIAVGIRPNRYSHKMVKETGDFVLNIPSTKQIEATVQNRAVNSTSLQNVDSQLQRHPK